MATQENLPQLPSYVKFRVLIIGRANAGKTSILKRVCGTTESPVSVDFSGTRVLALPISSSGQIELEPSIEVRQACSWPWPMADRDGPACTAW